MPSFTQKLTAYVDASYPTLHISSYEETRLVKEIRSSFTGTANEPNPKAKIIYEWDAIRGLISKDPLAKVKELKDSTDPVKLFTGMASLVKNQARLLFIMSDFHHVWKSPVKACATIAAFKQLIPVLKSNSATVLFVSHSSYIPQELIKEIQIMDYLMPDSAAIRAKLDFIVGETNTSLQRKFNGTPFQPLTITEEVAELAVNAAKGLTDSEIESAFSLAIVENKQFNLGFVQSVFSEKVQQTKKSGYLTHIETDISFENVAGLEQIKKWIRLRKQLYSQKARAAKLPVPKGIGLAGVQGCGKTLISKAIAVELNCPLYLLDISRLFSKYVGGTEENFNEVIKIIESLGRCVILIDEVEKYLSTSATSGQSDSGASSRSFGSLMTWLSERKSEAFLVLTSNDFTILPEAFVRKGRFDQWFWVDLPNEEELAEVFRVVMKKFDVSPDKFNIPELVEISKGYSGAEISGLFSEGMIEAFSEDPDSVVTQAQLVEIIKSHCPQSRIDSDRINYVRTKVADRLKPASSAGLIAPAVNIENRKIEVT